MIKGLMMKYSYQIGYAHGGRKKIRYIHVIAESMYKALEIFEEEINIETLTTLKIVRHTALIKD